MTTLSPERMGRITGSRVAGILGISPYDSADDVLRAMVREHFDAPSEFVGSRATEYGVEHEADGIVEWEFRSGEGLYATGDDQVFVRHPHVDYIGVTPDGLTGNSNAVEVKCPLYGSYTHWRDVPWYEAQCRLVAECVEADWVDLVVWRPEGTSVSRVERDPWWLEQNIDVLEQFNDRYLAAIIDEQIYGPLLASLTDLRTDVEWAEAAHRYREAVAVANVHESEVQAARSALLALTDKSAKGGGVSVSCAERKGSLDYKRALAELAPDADVEPYRKAGSTVWSVRVSAA